MQRYCLALDLKNDPALIEEYERRHLEVWPNILKNIKESGIEKMDIYRTGNRLFMIMEATDLFSFEIKKESDRNNAEVQDWEALMWKFQQALPWAKKGEKWVLMEKIFYLK